MRQSLLGPVLGLAAILSIGALPLVAQKTDVVVLENGDAIRGEVKVLERGRLKFDTDAADNIYIEWEKVRGLTVDRFLEIELETGERFFGSLRSASTEGRLLVDELERSIEIDRLEVVRITPIESTFWTRLEGLIEFGLTFAKANEALNLNSRATIDYRGRAIEHALAGSAFLQQQEDAEVTSRFTGSWRTTRLLPGRWFVGAGLTAERNDELALDVRAGIGGFGGKVLVQTNQVDWSVLVGVTWNRERFTGETSTGTTYEVPATTRLNWFLFGDNETSLDVRWTVYPSLTDFGRVRMDLDARFRRDLVLDFYVALSGYDSFDSRSTIDTSTNDFGFGVSVGYDF